MTEALFSEKSYQRPIPLTLGRFNLHLDPLGGRITHLSHSGSGRNLLETPQTKPTFFSDGSLYHPGGWDECFPTIDKSPDSRVMGEARFVETQINSSDSSLTCCWHLDNWILTRIFQAEDDSLISKYLLEGISNDIPPHLWAAHVILPIQGLQALQLPIGNPVAGPHCDIEHLKKYLPIQKQVISACHLEHQGLSWKFFLPASQPVRLTYEDLTLNFTTETPWWGIWINLDRFFSRRCLGIEASNAPTDHQHESCHRLRFGKTTSWSWRLTVSF